MSKPFSVVAPLPVNGFLKTLPQSRDRHPFAQISPNDIADADGKIDPADFPRMIKLLQDNVAAATEPVRTNPLVHGELHRKVAMTSSTQVVIKHGLGEAFGSYVCRRAYAGSAPFAAADAANNGGRDPKMYLVLLAASTGTYDIEINPK